MGHWASGLKNLFDERGREKVFEFARQGNAGNGEKIETKGVPFFLRLDIDRPGGPARVGGYSCQRILEQVMEVLGLVGRFGDLQEQFEAAVFAGELPGFARGNGLRLQARRPLLSTSLERLAIV